MKTTLVLGDSLPPGLRARRAAGARACGLSGRLQPRRPNAPRSGWHPLRDGGQRRGGAHVCEATEVAVDTVSEAKFDAGISARIAWSAGSVQVEIRADEAKERLLHWGVGEWQAPPEAAWPPGTHRVDDKAVQTPFEHGARVAITFPANAYPDKVVFVIKETQPEHWVSNGSADFTVQLRQPGADSVAAKVLQAEAKNSHWSLYDRFCLALGVLDAADAAGPTGMAFVLTWLRLSTNRQLDWYRNSAHQSKDIAHIQKTLAQRVADKARGSANAENRFLARLAMGALPRGGGDGDAIRMGILHIMRENGIREGHRPGIEDHFLEQWHQKLHTNTTPEDISICEAYLGCLCSGYPDDFWRFLWENHRITREQLANMDRPITATPLHLPQLIGPMQHYLWILKTCHAGADLDVAFEMARGRLDDDLAWNIGDLLANRTAWWVPGKLVELRGRLAHYWKAEGAPRDVLLLDIALDGYLRLCIERTDKGALSADDLISLVGLVLRNAAISHDAPDLHQCCALWERVAGEERWGQEWGLKAVAAAQRVSLSLAAFADRLQELVQPHARAFQEACGIGEEYIANFAEEVIRGQPLYTLSILLQHLEPSLRSSAQLAAWQVVSQAEAHGRVQSLDSLAEIQGQSVPRPTILVAERLGGNEDIPENVTAVLTASSTDVLSHVAIRARAQGVLLATCFEPEQLAAIRAMEGGTAVATVDAAGAVSVTAAEGQAADPRRNGGRRPQRVAVAPTRRSERWALTEREFQPGLVGGKSLKLAELRRRLPDGIAVPTCAALPFGVFERLLAEPANHGLRHDLDRLLARGSVDALADVRAAVRDRLAPAPGLRDEVAAVAESSGIIRHGEWAEGGAAWDAAWRAICGVWASKWTERAWLSRRARGIPEDDLKMAVLLQQIVPAEYAFVLHTADPVSGARGQLFGEVVAGMGESLVGNCPGRALAFAASEGGEPRLLALPGKRTGLFSTQAGNVIARSDSNGEDLEAFAGAGLYESVPLAELEERSLETAAEPLFWDGEARRRLLAQLADVGWRVEAALGGQPQDIEGVWVDGKVTVVQARPQVV